MLNVALISHSPHMTGAERMLTNLAILLKQHVDYEPIVLIPNPSHGKMPEVLAQHGIKWCEVPSMKWYIAQQDHDVPSYMSQLLPRAEEYAEALRLIQADIAIVNTLTNLEGALGCFEANLPYVLWAHGVIDSSMIAGTPAVRASFDKVALNLASHIVTCSEWTSAFFRDLVPHKTVQTIHNWTDMRADGDVQRRPGTFCALSTLEPHKGIDILIEAAAILKKQGLPVKVELYAAGHSEKQLRELTSQLGVDDVVEFRGRVADVQRVYQSCTATIMPSFVEPFGMVAIESMSVGTPVIASAAGGLTEIIEDGISGILVPPGDAVALASAMREVFEDEVLHKKLVSGGKQRVSEFFAASRAIEDFSQVLGKISKITSPYRDEERLLIDLLYLLKGKASSGSYATVPAPTVLPIENQMAYVPFSPTAEQMAQSRAVAKQSEDLSSIPFHWYSFVSQANIGWYGVEFSAVYEPFAQGAEILVEVVKNGGIAAQALVTIESIRPQTTCAARWPGRLDIRENDKVDIRFSCRNMTKSIRLLEWSDGNFAYPVGSLMVENGYLSEAPLNPLPRNDSRRLPSHLRILKKLGGVVRTS
ncbi:glycosyltransferase family 4 protein [Cupriavidus taiwanensis]|uniref:glycosyltransferase family 4 protein n=1 Tax=Cupriavidus taiwanensis TaxID=164546 RepID=UPI000E14677B|nr:hypothetical protein CBM2629_A170103 [Cupriavidus taiwanensis]